MVLTCLACRPFHQLQSPKVEVFLTLDRGWGVKAAQPITKGIFIVEYAGQFCTTTPLMQRASWLQYNAIAA